jgi:uncharacterized protein YgbK (DUF1537 family)
MSKLLLAYYGDDFTGSTDSLEFICRAGANAMLFIDPPTKETLDKYPNLQAFGVAGKTRALDPKAMKAVLIPAFEVLKQSGAKHIHYKVCSTFDSSPNIGNIGKAIECGIAVFKKRLVPLLVAAPVLGRYCMFGNLFARMGIGSRGEIYRLDRHPSMSKHPVTPMDESDLRLHLSRQTELPIELIDLLEVERLSNGLPIQEHKDGVLLIDAMYDKQLLPIGNWIAALQKGEEPLFSAGSSGIEMALGKHWNQEGALQPVNEWPAIQNAQKMLVVSGSCSPVTRQQIKYAGEHGFTTIAMDAPTICKDAAAIDKVVEKVLQVLRQDSFVLLHTGEKAGKNLPSEKLGTALGNIVRLVLEQIKVDRVIVAGGDSSSYAARAMQIEAVTMIKPVITGAPLCRAVSQHKAVDGIEINFKGGQVGGEDYFMVMRG